MEEARDLKWEDIKVGDTASFSRTITENDVNDFAKLSGDYNPLHMDENYAKTTQFGKRVVHGMFLGALISQLLGMKLIGKRCLYLSQDLQFKKPAFIGDTVKVIGEVKNKSESTHILDILIEIKKGEEILLISETKVQVL